MALFSRNSSRKIIFYDHLDAAGHLVLPLFYKPLKKYLNTL